MKRAYRTNCGGIVSVVAAESRGRAVAATVRAAGEAGYRVRFLVVRAVRAPEYDAWAALDATGACWDEKLLPAASPGEGTT